MNPHSQGRAPRPDPKTLQLCTQVAEALTYALGDSKDPLLWDLVVDQVRPMPDASHLLVVLQDPCAHGVAAALAALDRAQGFLRRAVAASISRRRVPQLSFTLVPPEVAP